MTAVCRMAACHLRFAAAVRATLHVEFERASFILHVLQCGCPWRLKRRSCLMLSPRREAGVATCRGQPSALPALSASVHRIHRPRHVPGLLQQPRRGPLPQAAIVFAGAVHASTPVASRATPPPMGSARGTGSTGSHRSSPLWTQASAPDLPQTAGTGGRDAASLPIGRAASPCFASGPNWMPAPGALGRPGLVLCWLGQAAGVQASAERVVDCQESAR